MGIASQNGLARRISQMSYRLGKRQARICGALRTIRSKGATLRVKDRNMLIMPIAPSATRHACSSLVGAATLEARRR